MSDLRTGNAPPELLIGIGLLSAALFFAMGVSIFSPGLGGVGLACMSAFSVGFAASIAKRAMGRKLKNSVVIGLIVGAAAAIMYVRWQTVDLGNHGNEWSLFTLPVAVIAGRAFSFSRSAAWFVDVFRPGGEAETSRYIPSGADQLMHARVERSEKGDLFVFDPAIQPVNIQEHLYYYDLNAHRVKRVHEKEAASLLTPVEDEETRLGCIREYQIWKTSFGEDAIREVIIEAERQEQK